MTGATGKAGRHVVGRLPAAGAAVRAPTREPGAARLPSGARSRYAELLPQLARERLIRDLVSPGLADTTLRFQAGLVGVPAEVTPTVPEVTGRPAGTFDAWAAEHMAAFRME
ncbi:hypothetical protein [Streptomyces sp. NPDC001621]|uniref:hypothetical protein n=1 Tax=Streptomyces sp. NPDC001621 TaxID=3364594 RepID=UPI003692FEAD